MHHIAYILLLILCKSIVTEYLIIFYTKATVKYIFNSAAIYPKVYRKYHRKLYTMYKSSYLVSRSVYGQKNGNIGADLRRFYLVMYIKITVLVCDLHPNISRLEERIVRRLLYGY